MRLPQNTTASGDLTATRAFSLEVIADVSDTGLHIKLCVHSDL